MNRLRLFLVNILVVLVLLAVGAVAFYYYNQSVTYVMTNNARIDGQWITISPMVSGQLIDWNGDIGKTYSQGERVGTIQTFTGTGSPGAKIDITFPSDGTIVQQNAVPRSFVTPGIPLARAFDLNHLWVTANVNETDINAIKIGQDVDVTVDAYPGNTLTGKVSKISQATAGTFSLLPSSNTTANYTKVTQVIPVIITLDGYKGLNLMPGMSVNVRIRKT